MEYLIHIYHLSLGNVSLTRTLLGNILWNSIQYSTYHVVEMILRLMWHYLATKSNIAEPTHDFYFTTGLESFVISGVNNIERSLWQKCYVDLAQVGAKST